MPDAALNLLLHFLYIFFKVLYRLSPHNQLARIADDFPPTMYKCHKLLYAQNKQFLKYVVYQWCNHGCNKCMKLFPGSVGKKDYSGFERHLWRQRCLEEHTKHIHEIRNCKPKTARNTLESKYGCRYSKRLDLCYFDPIRMTIIDPMHNLYLGSAKHVLKRIWIEQGLLNSKSFHVVQDRIDSILPPPYLGKIPHKIASGCSEFTADQFKTGQTYFP